jgi:hypothetical protein
MGYIGGPAHGANLSTHETESEAGATAPEKQDERCPSNSTQRLPQEALLAYLQS